MSTASTSTGKSHFDLHFDLMWLLQVVFADREGTSAQTALHHQGIPLQREAQQTQNSNVHPEQQLQQQHQQQQVLLQPQKWNVLYVRWQPRCSGQLKAQAVIASTGEKSAIVWSLEPGTTGMCLSRAC